MTRFASVCVVTAALSWSLVGCGSSTPIPSVENIDSEAARLEELEVQDAEREQQKLALEGAKKR